MNPSGIATGNFISVKILTFQKNKMQAASIAGTVPILRLHFVPSVNMDSPLSSLTTGGKKSKGQAARSISTGQLNALLRLHFQPINVVVYHRPSGGLLHGRSYLGVGFTLRCLQRLSLPDTATRHCHWHDNRNTGGPSIPVLSY